MRRWTHGQMLDLVREAGVGRAIVLVGIGGHGGAGKTTLARMVPDAQVVPTDEFWTGDGFDIERLATEVVTPLSRGAEALLRRTTGRLGPRGVRTIAPSGIVIIEGVCALHRALRDVYAVRVWVDAPDDVRLARGVARDGEAARATGSTSGSRPRIGTSSATIPSTAPTS